MAIARLIKCRPRDEAEYAVIVTDSWQQRTLGRALSEVCIDLARRLDFRVVNAETVQENIPIISVLNHLRFKMKNKERNTVVMALALK